MSKLKGLRDFFFVIEEDEEDQVPEQAASDDIEVAAQAARERVDAGPVGREPSGKTLGDYVDDPYVGEFDEDEFDTASFGTATPDLSSDAPFDDVYRAAGLPGADDPSFTIYKVEKILNSEHLAGLGDKSKAASVLVTLEASGVGLSSVITDAVGRDKALDQYDQMLRRDIKNLETDIEITNAMIETEIEDYLMRKREEIAANNSKLAQAKEIYGLWHQKKLTEENRLFNAISPFVAENPISRGDD